LGCAKVKLDPTEICAVNYKVILTHPEDNRRELLLELVAAAEKE
jgi:hypothetical protein